MNEGREPLIEVNIDYKPLAYRLVVAHSVRIAEENHPDAHFLLS